jgi:hypothetical protein
MLTDGRGEVTLALDVSRIDTLDEIHTRSVPITFTDPLRQMRLWFRVRSCSFPEPGGYQVALFADGEVLTQCVLNIIPRRDTDG